MTDSITHGPLLLSALELVFDSSFDAAEVPYSDELFAVLRDRADVFAYRQKEVPQERQLLVVPLEPGVPLPGPLERLAVADRLRAVGALVEYRLTKVLEQLELRRRRRPRLRLRRIKRSDDLVARAFKLMNRPVPRQLAAFHKYLQTDFEIRVVDADNGRSMIVAAVRFGRHQEIDGTATDASVHGVDLKGLDLIDRAAPPEARFLGTVIEAHGHECRVSTPTGVRTVDARACVIEPTLATFKAVFGRALSPTDGAAYDAAEWTLQAETSSGRGYTAHLQQLCEYFQGLGIVEIAPTVRCSFRGPVSFNVDRSSSAGYTLPPVEYCFSPDRSAMHQYPSAGLDRFGPFDSSTFDKKRPRVLVVAPAKQQGEVEVFIRRLFEGMKGEAVDRFQRGLLGIYRLVRMDLDWIFVELPGDGSPGAGTRYVHSLEERFNSERSPDIAIVVLRDRDSELERDNPYDATRAFLLSQGVPCQHVRLETIRKPARSLAYTLENIAVAVYAKLGGSPWTVTPTMPMAEEIVIGVGVAESGGRFESRQRFAGITTVFRSNGSYILAASSERCPYEEFPDVLVRFIQKLLRRLAADCGWERGDHVRLIFHSHQPLKKTDIFRVIEKAVQELGEGVLFQTAFLTIRHDHPFKIVDVRQAGREKSVELMNGGFGKRLVGVHVPPRGVVVDIGHDRQLLCVTGGGLVKRHGMPMPSPLLVELHPASTYRDLDSLVRQIYHFTGLSWRSMHPVGDPVTIFYSHLVAEQLVRLESVPHWSDGLLDTRLRRSRWFL